MCLEHFLPSVAALQKPLLPDSSVRTRFQPLRPAEFLRYSERLVLALRLFGRVVYLLFPDFIFL